MSTMTFRETKSLDALETLKDPCASQVHRQAAAAHIGRFYTQLSEQGKQLELIAAIRTNQDLTEAFLSKAVAGGVVVEVVLNHDGTLSEQSRRNVTRVLASSVKATCRRISTSVKANEAPSLFDVNDMRNYFDCIRSMGADLNWNEASRLRRVAFSWFDRLFAASFMVERYAHHDELEQVQSFLRKMANAGGMV